MLTDGIFGLLGAGLLSTLLTCLGHPLQRAIGFGAAGVDRLLFSFLAGLGVLAYWMLAMGWAGLLSPAWVGIPLLVACGLAVGFGWRDLRSDFQHVARALRDLRMPAAPGAAPWLALALLIAIGHLAVNLLNGLTPPLEGDTINSYLVVPKWWVLRGRIHEVTTSYINGFYGPGTQLATLALLLANETSALLLVGGILGLVSALLVARLAIDLGFGRGGAIWSFAVAVSLPDVWYESATTKLDLVGFALEIQTLRVALWGLEPDGRLRLKGILGVGFFAAAAFMGKMQSIALAPALTALFLADGAARGRWRASLANTGWVCLGVAALSSPVYAYKWIEFGNPIHHVNWGPFHSTGPASFNAADLDRYLPTFHGISGVFRVFAHHTFQERFHGFGPIVLLMLPWAALSLWRGSRRTTVLLAFSAAYFLTWFNLRQVSRDLLAPIGVLCALAGGVAAAALPIPAHGWVFAFARSLLALTACVLLLQNAQNAIFMERPQSLAKGLARERYLERVLGKLDQAIPRWDYADWLNKTVRPGERVLNRFSPVNYYIEPELVNSGDARVAEWENATDANAVLRGLRADGFSYLTVADAKLDGKTPLSDRAFLERHFPRVFTNGIASVHRVTQR